MKFAACIEYDGSAYCGWQRLSHAASVQAKVEQALSKVAAEPVYVTCAGRTDSGVHAVGQVIHFETGVERTERAWLLGTNVNLPYDIAIRWVKPVSADFNARFSALSRRYRYIILNRQAKPAVLYKKVAWYHNKLDAEAMHQAAQALWGEHDFSSFRAAGCQARHARREVQQITVTRQGDFIFVDIVANAFLHHMVRNIVGSLLKVGTGEQAIAWMATLLDCQDRKQAGITAPANGLYFVFVEYPAEFALPNAYHLPSFNV